jgi:hypothetical protein
MGGIFEIFLCVKHFLTFKGLVGYGWFCLYILGNLQRLADVRYQQFY